MPSGVYQRTAEHRAAMRAGCKGRPAHNKGSHKSPLGHSNDSVARRCETCRAGFQCKVKNIARGGGRFCSRRCNPSYWPKEPTVSKYRRQHLKRYYGLSPAQFEEMAKRQEGRCPLCDEAPRRCGGRRNALVVDHNHSTGRVRGLLCNSCNRALGWFGDDLERVRRAVEYLEADARWIAVTAAAQYGTGSEVHVPRTRSAA